MRGLPGELLATIKESILEQELRRCGSRIQAVKGFFGLIQSGGIRNKTCQKRH